jgi:chitin synthase
MLLLPSFVSVLTIYSFANLHDISWGTKGSTTVKDLGGATKKKTEGGKELVTVDLVSAPDDVDALWNGMRKEIGTPYVERHVKRDAGAKKEDHYANIR